MSNDSSSDEAPVTAREPGPEAADAMSADVAGGDGERIDTLAIGEGFARYPGSRHVPAVDGERVDALAIAEGGVLAGPPMAMFIRGGGTPTMAHERQIAEAEADANRRRDEALEERKAARIPVELGGGRLYENAAIDPGARELHVLLKLVDHRGEPKYDHGEPMECLADVRVISATELALIIVCPRCVSRDVPQGQCQIQIRQSNRAWHLDTRTAGSPIWFDGDMYVSAGEVMESEEFGCTACNWRAKIDHNKIWCR
jgi:hypothetical protein